MEIAFALKGRLTAAWGIRVSFDTIIRTSKLTLCSLGLDITGSAHLARNMRYTHQVHLHQHGSLRTS
ncbi:MAG: hypothetical protein FRX49_06535 [Trebouxia sp. A1-2]|nr:MAG: hypothetical protein FRX49_06535 [Trebouxia sp. A1-2]